MASGPQKMTKLSRLPRGPLPPIEDMVEPDGVHYVKIVRSLADAALVVVRDGDEIRFLPEFGRPTGVVAIAAAPKDAKTKGAMALTYRVAGSEHVETWLVGDEEAVRKAFEAFATFAGRARTEET